MIHANVRTQGATVMVFLDGSPQSISFSNGDDGLVMLPSQAASWQPSWWTGSRDGNFNQGRVVYKKNSFLASLAPEGWADESWWSIVTSGADFLTDLLPAPVEVLVRSVVTGAENIFGRHFLIEKRSFAKTGLRQTWHSILARSCW